MSNYTHCLRPDFTARMVQFLERGRSINLIGAEGVGRERLLADIRQCELPDTRTALVNMKHYRATYNGLVRELWSQLAGEEDAPATVSDVVERYEDGDDRIVLMLHNFDALLDTPDVDPKYNVAFYNALNYMKNKPRIALICVTRKPHDRSVIYVDGKFHGTSWLDLEPTRLPPLTYEEIVIEVKRQPLPDISLQERSTLIEAIREHDPPYPLLLFLREKLLNREQAELVFPQRLKKWRKQFRKEQKTRLLSKKRLHTLRQEIITWAKLSGVDKLKAPFSFFGKTGKVIAGILENIGNRGKNNGNT